MSQFLAVAPHPDDEVIACGPLLVDLLAAGHEVTVLYASLGHLEDHDRRRSEAEAASHGGGWAAEFMSPPAAISRDDDHLDALTRIAETVARLARGLDADVVIAPTPDDAHHGHETVGMAAQEALRYEQGATLWSWALWGALPTSTLLHPFGEPIMNRALLALSMYGADLVRNDYREVLIGMSRANAVLGSERVFGFGSARASALPYATVLCESVSDGSSWHSTQPRILDAAQPLAT